MPETLIHALETPSLPHHCELELVCTQCRARTATLLRGLAVTAELAALGSLRCAQCGSGRLELNDADRGAVLGAMQRLMQSRKPLPKDPAAFFRGGTFQWNGQGWEDPRKLREELEKTEQEKSSDPAMLLRIAAGYMQIGDTARALSGCERARALAPESPDTWALEAEIQYSAGADAKAAAAAREALNHKSGPNLILDGAATLARAAITVLKASETAGHPDASRKVGRNDACPCGSGKKYKRCCAA